MTYLLLLVITCLSSIAHSMETSTTPQSEKTTHADIVKKMQETKLDVRIYERYVKEQEKKSLPVISDNKIDYSGWCKNKKNVSYDNNNASLHIVGPHGYQKTVELGACTSTISYYTSNAQFSPDEQSLVISGTHWYHSTGWAPFKYFLHKNNQTRVLFTLPKFSKKNDQLNFLTNSIFYLYHDKQILLYNIDTNTLTSVPLPCSYKKPSIQSEGNGTIIFYGDYLHDENYLRDGIFIGKAALNNKTGDDTIIFHRLELNAHGQMQFNEITHIFSNMYNNQLFLVATLEKDQNVQGDLFSYDLTTKKFNFVIHGNVNCVTDHFIIKCRSIREEGNVLGKVCYEIINKNTCNSFCSTPQQNMFFHSGMGRDGTYTYRYGEPWQITPLVDAHLEKTAEFFAQISSMQMIDLLEQLFISNISSTTVLNKQDYNTYKHLPAAVQTVLGIHNPIFAYCALQHYAQNNSNILPQEIIQLIMRYVACIT